MNENKPVVETFDTKPLTSLLAKKGRLQKKRDDLLNLETSLPEEIAEVAKEMDPLDSKCADTLLILKARLECLPDKITEVDNEIAQVNEKLDEALVEAVSFLESIWAKDNELATTAAIQALQPWCTSNAEARNIAVSLPRISMLANSVRSVLYATDGEAKARLFLDLLKRYQDSGTLLHDDVLACLPTNSETKN
ncbi:MAG: hypothetical protein A2283_22970 [Lentisphaerae bacterium RIFOXYA12_FULL_48_11]|nr:MAG: hypothetical protein A2283_22970 [Lentisphaerae bacterium RIFOXYA12_FULL_48_11]